jgi:hypothetical protein
LRSVAHSTVIGSSIARFVEGLAVAEAERAEHVREVIAFARRRAG